MAADDHEIRDIGRGMRRQRRAMPGHCLDRAQDWAWQLYLAHQRSHGPDLPSWAPPGPGSGRREFWYAFDVGPFAFFCFDTRFERVRDSETMLQPLSAGVLPHLVGEGMQPAGQGSACAEVYPQRQRGLSGRQGVCRPCPNTRARSDSWLGYPKTRRLR